MFRRLFTDLWGLRNPKGLRRLFALTATVLTLLALVTPAHADGIIIPEPPPHMPVIPPPLTIKYHRVTVTIEGQVATTHVDQVFINEADYDVEGIYLFPLPKEASIGEFAMWVDGQRLEGQVLERDKARRIYEDIVRKRRDPALLEYIGRNAFQARVFPIPAHGEKRIELEYQEVLPMDQGLVRYVYPLDTERLSARPIEEVSIHVELHADQPLRSVYSPSHKVAVDRRGEYNASIGYEEYDVLPDRDFVLYYSVAQEDIGLNLLTYRDPAEDDGFFLLLVAPPLEVEEQERVAKDVILVLDTSGSMGHSGKLQQAKEALGYVLDHLHEDDRFNIVAFSTGVRTYVQGLRPASERNAARRWVERLEAAGGTDINRALLEALSSLRDGAREERPAIIIFLTDGLATEGVVETDRILENVDDAAPPNVRLFPFGVGDEVNTLLLDTLAERHRGATAYVRPGERIDEAVSAFYAKVSTPVLADVTLDCGDVIVEDVYPYPLPDLFAGTQLIVVGRYRNGGTTDITLTGTVNDQERRFVYPDRRFRETGGEEFIPRLWATRKIGYLLTQIRLHGEDKELVDEIVRLAVRYGIVTPYTSFLVEEEYDVLSEEGREKAAEEQLRLYATPAPVAGAPAVEKSLGQRDLREAESVGSSTSERVRQVGDRAFILQDGVWVDTTFDPEKMTPAKVGFSSDAYFELLQARPDLGPYLALGPRVIVVVDGQAYEVVEEDVGPVTPPPPLATVTPRPTPTATPVVVAVTTPEATPETTSTTTPAVTPSPSGGLCPGVLSVVGLALLTALLGWLSKA